jgi:hypothetical protein
MKKVALSLLALAVVAVGAFADATSDVVKNPVTATLNINATGMFGVDLDTKNHSLGNEVTTKLTLWFLNGSSEKTGEGDVHGYIKAADIKFGFDDSASLNNLTSVGATGNDAAERKTTPAMSFGDVTAKIVAGDLYVKLYTNTDPSQGYAADGDDDNGGATTTSDDTIKKYSAKYGATGAEWTSGNAGSYSSFGGTGLEVGYTIPSTLSITVTAASNGNMLWGNAQQVGYEGSIAANLLSVEKLTLGGKFYTGKSTDALNAAGVEVAYDLGVIAPYAHVNYNLTDSVYSTDFGAKAPLADGLLVDAVVLASNTKAVKDVALGYTITAKLSVDKLAGPLFADVGFRQSDVTKSAQQTAVATEAFAKVGLKASDVVTASGTVDFYNGTASSDASTFLKAQIEYTGISLTTLGLYWDSSDLGALKSTGDSKLGQFVVKAKVAY